MTVKYVIDGKDYVTLQLYEMLEDKYKQLEEENKKLKIKVASLEWEIKWLNSVIDKLHKEIEEQEAEWGWLFDEIDYRKRECKKLKEEKEIRALNDRDNLIQIEKLGEENKKLKSDLSECECSFWFENDEVWFWKREYKRLKKWIKDHCKWYWNLFPEDEMKRQWKKADKKRKSEWMFMEEDTLQELRDIGEI